MSTEVKIYISIEKAGIQRLTLVWAIPMPGDLYLIAAQPYDRLSETWEYPPGTKVRCQKVTVTDREVLVAFESAE